MRRGLLLGVALLVTSVSTTLTAGTATAADRHHDRATFSATNGASAEYQAWTRGAGAQPGLLVYLHGDGAWEYDNPEIDLAGRRGIAPQARRHGMVTVAARTPDRFGHPTWWEEAKRNGHYLRDLLEHLTAEYDVDRSRIWLVGYSGGSHFLTTEFLPRYHGELTGGGAILFAGGAPPEQPVAFPSELLENFTMHWYTGRDDEFDWWSALADARAGASWYSGNGFGTSLELPARTGHILEGKLGSVVRRHLDAAVTAGSPHERR